MQFLKLKYQLSSPLNGSSVVKGACIRLRVYIPQLQKSQKNLNFIKKTLKNLIFKLKMSQNFLKIYNFEP